MFRWCSYGIDLLAGLLLLLAPVLVLHWVLTILNLEVINGLLSPMTAVTTPVYTTVEGLLPFALPTTAYGDQTITVIPMAVALTLLVLFFVLSGTSAVLRRAEVTLGASGHSFDAIQTQQRATQLARAQQQQQQALQRDSVLVMIAFPFERFAGSLEQLGKPPVVRQAGCALYQFPQPEPALNFAKAAYMRLATLSQQLGGYEAPASVTMVLHAVPSTQGAQAGYERCQLLSRYCQPNQVLFSQQLHEVMAAQNILQNFSHFSTGIYQIPNERPQDIYQLEIRHPQQQVYF